MCIEVGKDTCDYVGGRIERCVLIVGSIDAVIALEGTVIAVAVPFHVVWLLLLLLLLFG